MQCRLIPSNRQRTYFFPPVNHVKHTATEIFQSILGSYRLDLDHEGPDIHLIPALYIHIII